MNLSEYINKFSTPVKTRPMTYRLRYLTKPNLIVFDFDVYLEKYKRNLQRDFVWNLEQKQELIKSLLLDRNIPPISIIVTNKNDDNNFEVIDGKQRLSTVLSFFKDEFSIPIGNSYFKYSELPDDFKIELDSKYLSFNECIEYTKITDDQKIFWFNLLNFSGTEQNK